MEESVKSKRKLSFGRRLLIFFVGIFAFLGALSMTMCALSPFVSPETFVWASFFGLTFWPILIFNLLILIALVLLKSRKTLLISLFAIIIAVPGFKKSYSVNHKYTEEGSVKVLSYNVKHFQDINNNRRKADEVKNDIAEIILQQNADVVCVQESGLWNEKKIADFASKIDCKYYATTKKYSGNVIFSKFPVEDDEFTEDFNKEHYSTGFIKLIKGGEKGNFYLECAHLKSFMISGEEIEYLNNASQYVENSETMGKSLIIKLKEGFKGRVEDSKMIIKNLPYNDIPIVICGDFNDTPLSYTYHNMRSAELRDAFTEVGKGVGKTYCGRLPLLRIDYFWISDGVIPMTFDVVKRKLSDHYPIVMTFDVRR